MQHAYPRLPTELLRRILSEAHDEYDRAGLAKRASLVSREWTELGQELLFGRVETGWNNEALRFSVVALDKHLKRYPHLAGFIAELSLGFDSEVNIDLWRPLRGILRRCSRLGRITWRGKVDLLEATLPFFPFAGLTSLSICTYGAVWTPSALLRVVLPRTPNLQTLVVDTTLPKDTHIPASFPAPPFQLRLSEMDLRLKQYGWRDKTTAKAEAILLQRFLRFVSPRHLTMLSLSFRTRNANGVFRWSTECHRLVELRLNAEDDLGTVHLPLLTAMVVNMRQLTRLSIKTTVGWTPKMSPAELDQHSFTLANFLDVVPTSLTDFTLGIWIPGGTCWSLVKSFLRQRTYNSPLRHARFSVEVPEDRRVELRARKQQFERSRWENDEDKWVWQSPWLRRPAREPSNEEDDPWPFADTERRSRKRSWELVRLSLIPSTALADLLLLCSRMISACIARAAVPAATSGPTRHGCWTGTTRASTRSPRRLSSTCQARPAKCESVALTVGDQLEVRLRERCEKREARSGEAAFRPQVPPFRLLPMRSASSLEP